MELDFLAIISKAGDGKSTFISQMSPEYLIVDLDSRWAEQKTVGKSHVIKSHDVEEIVSEMERLSKTEKNIGTVAYDSGTSLLDYIIAKGQLKGDAAQESGKKFNMNAVHRTKAATMRVLRLSALRFNANVVWVFHHEDRMESGQKRVRTSIPLTELEALKSNLNAVITIVKDQNGMRGVRVEWCRYSEVAKGQTIWDYEGMWKGVPQKLHTFIREFKGTEGYNGNAYSYKWMFDYLAKKEVKFKSVEDMKSKIGAGEPLWFDKNAWVALVEKAKSLTSEKE